MVVSVSFEKRVPPGSAKRGTLAELMAKQKAQADLRNQAMQEETPTIMQGLGKMANVLGAAWGERRAEKEEMAGRDELARIKAQVGLGEATPEQLAQIGAYDPDLETTMRKEALEARQREQDRQNQLTDLQETRQYETSQEGAINERERLEQEARDKVQREEAERVRLAGVTQEGTVNERERLEAEAVEKRQVAEAERIRLAGVEAGKQTILSGDAAVAEGAQPGQQVIKSGGGQLEVKDAPKVKQARPATPEERLSYNVPPDQGFAMESEDGVNWTPKGIGSAPNNPLVSPEAASRAALMVDFFKKYAGLSKEVAEGGVSGVLNTAAIKTGAPTRATEIVREIATGAEALVRNLTGAGMPESEARTYVDRYQPTLWSALGPEESMTKLRELNEDMWNVYSAVTQGRRWTDDPTVFKLREAREADAAAAAAGVNPANPAATPAPADPNAPAAPATGGLPTPQTVEEFNALPPGTEYIDPEDGKRYKK